MQTKKRARPVKFGRQADKENEKPKETSAASPSQHHTTHHESSPFKAAPAAEGEPRQGRAAEGEPRAASPTRAPETEKKESAAGDNFKTDELTRALAGFFKSIEDDNEKEHEQEKERPVEKEPLPEKETESDLKEEFASGSTPEPEEEIHAEDEPRQRREESIAEAEKEKPVRESAVEEESPEANPAQSRSSKRWEEEPEPDIEVEEQSVKVVHRSAFSNFDDEEEVVEKPQKKGNAWVFFILIALVAFVVGLIAMAAVVQFNPGSAGKMTAILPDFTKEPTSTPIPTQATPTITPTEAPADLTAYTVTVYNGSGITGEAAKLKAKLVAAGFKVGTVGNASSSDISKTTVEAKSTVNKAYVDKLEETLKKSYTVEDPTTHSSGTGDVVVTIGSTPAQ